MGHVTNIEKYICLRRAEQPEDQFLCKYYNDNVLQSYLMFCKTHQYRKENRKMQTLEDKEVNLIKISP